MDKGSFRRTSCESEEHLCSTERRGSHTCSFALERTELVKRLATDTTCKHSCDHISGFLPLLREGGQTLWQIALRGYGGFIPGDIQNPTGYASSNLI